MNKVAWRPLRKLDEARNKLDDTDEAGDEGRDVEEGSLGDKEVGANGMADGDVSRSDEVEGSNGGSPTSSGNAVQTDGISGVAKEAVPEEGGGDELTQPLLAEPAPAWQ